MSMECEKIINSYIKWIKDNTLIRTVKEGAICNITTPFLDRHNDHLEIYVKKSNSSLILTDDGHTIADLKMSGFQLNSPKREKIFKTVLNGFGVKAGENDELYVEANIGNVGQKKHYLLQAIITVNDMYTLSQENVYSLFKEEVERYFKSNEIIYSKDIKIGGKTGFDHNIDFLIPASKNKSERLIRALNAPKKDSVMAAIFSFGDIAAIREQESADYVIYNDEDNSKVSQDAIAALFNYGIKSIPWSKKEQYKEEFRV